jgi:PqqD family protein of HPr-rel-A system
MQRIRSLALNPDGFAFDPTTGESYTVNAPGLAILQALQEGHAVEELPVLLADAFDVGAEEATRDVYDFLDHLRAFRLL